MAEVPCFKVSRRQLAIFDLYIACGSFYATDDNFQNFLSFAIKREA